MNLHAIAAPIIAAVNPPVMGAIQVSDGYTTAADGSRTPTYQSAAGVPLDVQALTAQELTHIDALNIQGVLRGVWLNGDIEGLDRPAGKGGDILIFNNQSWLVVHVLETWDTDGWCHVAVQLQGEGTPP